LTDIYIYVYVAHLICLWLAMVV